MAAPLVQRLDEQIEPAKSPLSAKQLCNFDFFTSSAEEIRQIATCLKNTGCCPRCILRFLGENQPESYSFSSEELEIALLPLEVRKTSSDTSDCPCPACLGILQKFAARSFFDSIKETVLKEGYQFSDHQCSLILPVSLIIRQRAMYLFLKKKFGEIYCNKEETIPQVKNVWKWACGPPVADLLSSKFQSRSPFDILLTFNYEDSDKECNFLLDTNPDVFRKRKQRKFGFETFTRVNVAKALYDMTDSRFEDHSRCPPVLPTMECTCSITCSHDAVFIAGRYRKLCRDLSQTPWLIDGKRLMESSVQELICQPILDVFKTTDHRLSSSGREDVDVRMLGLGRPFVVELINPHCVKFSQQDMMALQQVINGASDKVQVRDIQIVSREDTSKLKEGEIDKSKTYSAHCWCERELSEGDLNMLSEVKELTLHQKTPLRVLHRRSCATRDRVVHSMKATKLSQNHFQLQLTTQAGTYIKEFIHGDFGRTTPSMSELLDAECDIIDLDVESVDVAWPPFIDPIPEHLKVADINCEPNTSHSKELIGDGCTNVKLLSKEPNSDNFLESPQICESNEKGPISLPDHNGEIVNMDL